MKSKAVKQIHPALRDDIGDLVTRRPVPGPTLAQVDPFLFLNHHGPQTYPPGNGGLPFGPHPHRGFETVTFVLDGALAHTDSAGHESIIEAGGVQWMTAGRGLIHSEVSPDAFKRRGGALEILQLWVNLPGRLKMTPPRYVGLRRDAIPALVTEDGRGVVHLIAGRWRGHAGPIASLTGVFMSTVELPTAARVAFPGIAGRSVFLYVVRGSIDVGTVTVPQHTLAQLNEEGDILEITARENAVLLVGHADPIGEAVVAHGPFVMNTREEIAQAIRDYQAGMFAAETVGAAADGGR